MIDKFLNNKKNQYFFITWLVVLLLNQILLFNDCPSIYCVLVSLPHTAIIAWVAVSLYMQKKDNDDEYIDIQKWNKKQKKNNSKSKKNTSTSSAGNSNTKKPSREINDEKIQKRTQANKYGWNDKFSHPVTNVNYPKFEFDINGWSLEKVYLSSTNTDEYINMHTGDKYSKAKIDYYGKKKNTKKSKATKRRENVNWDNNYIHKKTGVKYTKFNFDINGWSTIKLFLPSSNTFEYINMNTGDKYNKSGLDYSGKKKLTIKEIKKNERAEKYGWDERFTHKITKVSYPIFEFDINSWSLEKVHLPSTKTDEYINLYTGDKYNKSGLDYSGKKKSITKGKHSKASVKNNNKRATRKEDKEFKDLKQELKSLMQSLEKLREEKNQYINKVNEFNAQYISKLGDLIKNRQDVLEKIKAEKKVEIFEEYHEYDIVHNYEFLAYEEELKQTDEGADNKELLKSQVEELRKKREQLEKDIQEFSTSETCKEISSIDSFDKYFDSVKDILEEEYAKLKKQLLKTDVKKKITKTRAKKKTKLQIEKSKYSQKLYAIQTRTFERLRRVSANLNDDGMANNLNIELANNGKQYKALVYSALDEFMEEFNGETINLVDWECGQGIAAAIFVDYVREKQLDIKVANVYLIDDVESTVLSRAMLHVDMLKQDNINIVATHPNQIDKIKHDIGIKTIYLCVNNNTLQTVDLMKFNFETNYYVCLSNHDENIVNSIYELLNSNHTIAKVISNRNGKIGRYKRYEKIFCIDQDND